MSDDAVSTGCGCVLLALALLLVALAFRACVGH